MSKFKFYLKNSFGSLPKINFQFFFFSVNLIELFRKSPKINFQFFLFFGSILLNSLESFFSKFLHFCFKNFNDAQFCWQELEVYVRIHQVGLESQKGYNTPELKHASTLQLREQRTTSEGIRQLLTGFLPLCENVRFYTRKSNISFAGLKTKRNIEFFLFFPPNFDIKWKSKHSFFVCFQQRLLKLKYYDELKKSKVLSILIFHIASFFKEKNNACRRESCFFTETIFLSQRVLFWDGETWFFFRRGSWNCSL